MTRPATAPSVHAIIMAGGSGTRFWPASRRRRPKQLLPLAHGEPLLVATVRRALALAGAQRTWVVTNAEQAEHIALAAPELTRERILVEPEPRDTAPCIAYATAHVEATDPGAVMVVMPADHLIRGIERFETLMRRGVQVASDGRTLVTFGIEPTGPSTSFGYVEEGDALDEDTPRASRATRFHEKPDAETAATFLSSGRYLWNSGIFVWTATALLEAMEHGDLELARSTKAMLEGVRGNRMADIETAFRSAPARSIDYAVLEHAPRVAVVRADLEWHDLGSFLALGSVAPPDPQGNVVFCPGEADAILEEAENCIVYGEGPRAVALFGVDDLVVVAVDDAVLVCPKSRAEQLKQLVERVRARRRDDLL